MQSPVPYRIVLFGSLAVHHAGGVVTRFRTRKAAALLAYLAMHPRLHSRDALAELLWPESDPESARINFRQALSALRRELEPEGASLPPLVVTKGREEVGLDPAAFLTDVAAFELTLQAAGRPGLSVGEHSRLLSEAVAHYAGVLLPGIDEPWVIQERKRLARAFEEASARLAHGHGRSAPATATPTTLEPATITSAEPAASAPRPGKSAATGEVRLPLTLTRFFGREAEIGTLCRRLTPGGDRFVTLTGAGGSGKTRLCIEAAKRLAGVWGGAIFFVPLADITDPGYVFPAIRDALRLPSLPGVSARDQVVQALAERPALLLLDNYEQLVEEGAVRVAELLEELPQAAVLVTSRQTLALPGEVEIAVAPLPVPNERAAAGALQECSSTALFLDRARVARGVELRVDARGASAVATICRRLDGIPLAIELAAARSAVLSPVQMLEKLGERGDLLSTRQRGIPERHRTLRAAIEWSYGLLSPELQRLFARLSVFRGGWTIESAEAVCDEPDALDLLTRLRECSLVVTEERGDRTRFRMLETLREYAGTQLADAERPALERRYADYFSALAAEAEPHLRGPEQTTWIARLEVEQDNLRAVLGWALESDPLLALNTGASLALFWETRGQYAEGLSRLERALASTSTSADDLSLARARCGAGRLAFYTGDLNGANAHLHESLSRARAAGDGLQIARALNAAGLVAVVQGEFGRGSELFGEALELSRDVADPTLFLDTLVNLGHIIADLEARSETCEMFAEGVRRAREIGDRRSLGMLLTNLGMLLCFDDRLEESLPLLQEGLEVTREAGETWNEARSHWCLGHAAVWRAPSAPTPEERAGYAARGRQHFSVTLRIIRGVNGRWETPYILEAFALVAAAEGEMGRSAWLFGAAEALRERLHSLRAPAVQPHYDRFIALARAAIGEDAYAAEHAAGHARGSEIPDNAALTLLPPTDD